MTDADALSQLAHECPRKIMGLLHAQGQYFHYTSPRFPGKVLCFHKDSEVPADCTPTKPQSHFLDLAHNEAQATG
ncbi:MAG: hypothetical protein EBV06_12505 [Planctomycetia bacterium]|nr:hypothetical protein [Planctomycetia bacterium]